MQLKGQSTSAKQAQLGVIVDTVPWSVPLALAGSWDGLWKAAIPRAEEAPRFSSFWTASGSRRKGDSLAGRSPLGVCASGLQGVKHVQVARLVVLQRDEGRGQRAQKVFILHDELIIGVCGVTLSRRDRPSSLLCMRVMLRFAHARRSSHAKQAHLIGKVY